MKIANRLTSDFHAWCKKKPLNQGGFMNFKSLIVFFLVFSMAIPFFGCSSDSEETTTTTTTQPPVSEIQEDRSVGLKGTDVNTNGIRDDIDKLIEQKFSYRSEVKQVAEQKARALQQFMEATTKEDALRTAEQIARATSCVYKILSDPERDYDKRQAISKELEAWTANTKERLTKYLESNKLVGGTYFTQPVEPVCD